MIFSSVNKLLAVADGEAVSLRDLRERGEEADSGGFAVEPISGTIYSPVSGRVESVAGAGQSYGIRADDGLDILIRIGEERAGFLSRGFISLVERGDVVRAGDVIAKADIAMMKLKGYSVTTPVLITNREKLQSCDLKLGWVRGGRSAVMTYKKTRRGGL